MTQQEADAFLIGYFEQAAEESDTHARRLEELAPKVTDRKWGELMSTEAKFLREQAARFRAAAKELSQSP